MMAYGFPHGNPDVFGKRNGVPATYAGTPFLKDMG